MRASSPLVLFRAAAGPRTGFGHLVRCGVLADALGVRRELALRGSGDALTAAVHQGWTVHDASPRLLDRIDPDLLVIDDPSSHARRAWMRRARRLGIPVVLVMDGASRGIAGASLVIDGSPTAPRTRRPGVLAGPRFAILRQSIAQLRRRPIARRTRHVLVALGGGMHSRRLGVSIALAIRARVPFASIDIAAGFTGAPRRALPPHCRWIDAPSGLAQAMASATVVVTGGGLTLLESCAVGTPAVAVAVAPAQTPAIRALAARGAVLDATHDSLAGTAAAAAGTVCRLISNSDIAPRGAAGLALRQRLARRAAAVLDGRGVERVAAAIHTLLAHGRADGRRHAA